MTLNIRPKRSLGQNFLTDPHYLERICEAAQVWSKDQVIEIGPGRGHLTRELASRAGRLIVIELDGRLVPVLRQSFAADDHVEVVHADALHFDYCGLDGTWKVVANLPYYISTPIIQRLLVCKRRFSSLTLMLQKEVAERIASPPGGREYGFLSVLVQYSAAPRLEFAVPAGAFTPKPKVDSALVTLTIRADAERTGARDEDLFLRVVKAAFSQRRKTLRNSLAQLGYGGADLEAARTAAGIDLGRRAETLSVADYIALADALSDRPAADRRYTENT